MGAQENVMEEWIGQQCADEWGVKLKTWHGYVARRQAPQAVRRVGRTPLWDAQEVRDYPRPGQGARTDRKDADATTDYGTWNTVMQGSDSVPAYLGDALGDFAGDYDLERFEAAFREAIAAVLPDGVTLHGKLFMGPYATRHDVTDTDLREAIERIDFWALAARFDKTQA